MINITDYCHSVTEQPLASFHQTFKNQVGRKVILVYIVDSYQTKPICQKCTSLMLETEVGRRLLKSIELEINSSTLNE